MIYTHIYASTTNLNNDKINSNNPIEIIKDKSSHFGVAQSNNAHHFIQTLPGQWEPLYQQLVTDSNVQSKTSHEQKG